MRSEYLVPLHAATPYDKRVSKDWRRVNAGRTPGKMIVQSWRASARNRHRPVTIATKPFDHRGDT